MGANLLQVLEKTSTQAQNNSSISAQKTDNQTITKAFSHLRTYRNSEYEKGLKIVPLRSCLLHNNVNTISYENQPFQTKNEHWIIKTKPKWKIDLLESHLDKETGEISVGGVYSTDDLKSGNNRKIKALNRFCDTFQPLYKKNKVSILFYTFTLANQSKTNIRDLFNSFKMRLKRKGIDLKGYVWVLEISEKLHVHYHALVCVDRINLKGKSLPNYLKLNDLWGCRTQVAFAQKHVRNYLAKYFTKNSSRILKHRSYGISIKGKYKTSELSKKGNVQLPKMETTEHRNCPKNNETIVSKNKGITKAKKDNKELN